MNGLELPVGWSWQPLESLSTLITDGTHITPDYQPSGVRFTSIQNLRRFEPVDWNAYVRFITPQAHAELTRRAKPERGDILIAKIGTLGLAKVIDFDEEVSIFVGLALVKPRRDLILPEYLEAVLNSPFHTNLAETKARGAGRKTLPLIELRSFPIPLPYPNDPSRSLETQRRLVAGIEALLAEVRAARELHQEVVADTGRLMEAVVQEEFDRPKPNWSESILTDVAVIQTGTAKGRHFGERMTIELPYLRVANVQAGYLDLNEVKTIAIAKNEVDRYRLQVNDLLLTEGGDHDKLGRGVVWDGQIDPCIHQNHIFAVRFDPDVILPRFAEYEMQSRHAKSYFLGVAKKTTNLATINKTKLGSFPVRYPSLAEQKVIVAHLDAVRAEIVELQRTQHGDGALVEQMEQAILAQAFRGDL